jgi:pyruvate dehydrogenase E2 component (dihydrolipoamide acetyltransferase)
MPVTPIVMPKWGLAMQEGTLAKWAVSEGAALKAGQEIADIETSKIANVYESPVGGVLRKIVAKEGDVLPVGALLAVVADKATPDAEVEAFTADFLANFKVEAPAEKPPEPQLIEVNGKKLRYLKLGDGDATPALLIHGFGADHGGFMFNHAALATDRPVYAVDLPGHGGSSKDVGDGSVQTIAADVRALMKALNLDRVHLVGHSLGGAIAILMALANPKNAASLTLIAPAGLGAEINEAFIEGFITETRGKKLRPYIEMLVVNPAMVSADMVEDVLKFKRLDGASGALRKIADKNFAGGKQFGSLRKELAGLGAPTLVIWGDKDQVLPAAHADGLGAAIHVTRLKDAGHIPHMEKAGDVNAAIGRHLGETS